jgi:hypothetical protein
MEKEFNANSNYILAHEFNGNFCHRYSLTLQSYTSRVSTYGGRYVLFDALLSEKLMVL